MNLHTHRDDATRPWAPDEVRQVRARKRKRRAVYIAIFDVSEAELEHVARAPYFLWIYTPQALTTSDWVGFRAPSGRMACCRIIHAEGDLACFFCEGVGAPA